MSSQCNFVEKFSLDGVHPPVRAHECNGWPRRGKTPSEEAGFTGASVTIDGAYSA